MQTSSQRLRFGVSATVALTSTGVQGSTTVGISEEAPEVPLASLVGAFRAIMVEGGGVTPSVQLGLTTMNLVSATAWTAGSAQSVTRTVTGTATDSGSEDWAITAAVLAAPIVIAVYRYSDESNADYAARARQELAANASVNEYFVVSGTAENVILTAKPTFTTSQNGVTVNVYPATDGTMALTMTTTITNHSSTSSSTAGVRTTGAYVFDLDGKDVQGDSFGTIGKIYGYQLWVARSGAGLTSSLSDTPTKNAMAFPVNLAKGRVQHYVEAGITPAGNLTLATAGGTGIVDATFAFLGKP